MFYRLALVFLCLLPTSFARASQVDIDYIRRCEIISSSGVDVDYSPSVPISDFNWKVSNYLKDLYKNDVELLGFLKRLPAAELQSWDVLVIAARTQNVDFFQQVLELVKPHTVYQVQGTLQRLVGYEWHDFVEVLIGHCTQGLPQEVYGDAAQFRFSILMSACIEGNLELVRQELLWQKNESHDLNRISKHALCAKKFRGRKQVIPEGRMGWINWPYVFAPKVMHTCPLHAAVGASNYDIVAYLLQQGLNQDLVDHEGYTAEGVVRCLRDNIEKTLREYGEGTKKPGQGRTAHLATRTKMLHMLQLFKKYSSNHPETTCPELLWQMKDIGKSPKKNSTVDPAQVVAAVALKLSPGLASALIKDSDGNNPLHVAVMVDNGYLVELILSLNPELFDTKNNKQMTPVELAVDQEKWDAIAGFATVRVERQRLSTAVQVSELLGNEKEVIDGLFVLEKALLANSEECVRSLLVRNPDLYESSLHVPKTIAFEKPYAQLPLYLISKGKFKALAGVISAAYRRQELKKEQSSLFYAVSSIFYSGLKLLLFFK